ncbi:MAG: HD domain-containing protein [Fibrobacterales bacterium]
MIHQDILTQAETFVKTTLHDAEGGHDWWHSYRVWKLSRTIAEGEDVDALVVELAALLHDIGDSKFNGGDETIGPKIATQFLESIDVDTNVIEHVVHIINNISYKGGHLVQTFHSKELDVVQDADRLDALGAIGISRAFSYGGHKGREIYNPDIPPQIYATKEEYKKSTSPSFNHFTEKLLLLKNSMNTQTGKAMAQERHRFLESYMEQFLAEWDGRC